MDIIPCGVIEAAHQPEYNFPQSRVTDHRIGLTLYNLPSVLNGEIQTLIDALQLAENAERMKESVS